MICYDLPADAYHASDAVGSTTLKQLAKHPPAYVKWRAENPETKDEYDIGTVAHSVILEDDWSGVEIIYADDKRGKKWSEPAALARGKGKTPLLAKEASKVWMMYRAVKTHSVASKLLTGHKAEVSYFASVNDLDAKCRADAMHEGIGSVTDLKTVATADPNEFDRSAYGFGYHQQVAWYQDVIQAATGFQPTFNFVLVEKTPPYLVSVVELSQEFVDYGREANARAAELLKHCRATEAWPGYDVPAVVQMPAWARRKEDDLD